MSTARAGNEGRPALRRTAPARLRGAGLRGERRKRRRAPLISRPGCLSSRRSRRGEAAWGLPPAALRGAIEGWGRGGPARGPPLPGMKRRRPRGRWAVASRALRFPASRGQPPRRGGRVPPGCGAGPRRRWDSASRRAARPPRRGACRGLQVGGRGPVEGGAEGGLRVPASPGRRSALGLLGTGRRGGRGGGRRTAAPGVLRARPRPLQSRAPSLCVRGSGRHRPPLCAGRTAPPFLPASFPPRCPPLARRRPGPARPRAVTLWAAAAPARGAAPQRSARLPLRGLHLGQRGAPGGRSRSSAARWVTAVTALSDPPYEHIQSSQSFKQNSLWLYCPALIFFFFSGVLLNAQK